VARALEHAESLIDRTHLSAIKTNVLLIMGRIPEALACGRAAAQAFGVELPEQPDQVRALLHREVQSIRERAAAVGIERLLDRPAMHDPAQIALMGLLMHCLPAAFQTDQESYALLCCTMVRLSLEHGNCALSARAYGSFAALLSSQLREYDEAYRFAKLGVDLAHKLDETSMLSGVYFLFAMFASHWVKPIDESVDLYEQAVRFGLQSGDHVHAGYSVGRRFSHLQVRGTPLAELKEEGAAALEMLQRISDAANVDFLMPRLSLIDWLAGERRHGDTLGTETLDEAQWTEATLARGNRSFEADWFMMLTIQRYHAEDFDAAHGFAERAAALQPFCAGFATRVEHAMYYALAMAAVYKKAPRAARAGYDAKLAVIRDEMRRWVALCPENTEHMQLLIDAECARLRGDRIEAADCYDRAIAAAHTNRFLNLEALAAELASRFWFGGGKPEFARIYLDKALDAYEAWGAFGKVNDLKKKHGISTARSTTASVTAGSTTFGQPQERANALDLATLLKASQAIAGEIVLDRLLVKLLDIVRENAGAESAVLVLETDGEFLVQAVKTGAGVLIAEPLRSSAACATGVVHYVLRTSELVVLDDAAQQGKYRNDPYVSNRRPKSILCAPVAHKGKLIGAIYLENNQVAGAFTPDRLEALNILMAQVAVSIENATLYSQQERQTREIEAANVTLTKEIAERKRAETELGRYRDHLEDLVKARTRELESAQGRLVDLSRRAGMAEVASGVLHNVGNVMNSVNVGAGVAREKVGALPVEGLARAVRLLDENAQRLAEFISADPVGRKLPEYLRKLAAALAEEKHAILGNIEQLLEHLEHMKKIIAAQQSYAKLTGMTEVCTLEEIAESALAISDAGLRSSNIEVVRSYEPLPPVLVDRHQIMQILVNLVSNAKHALEDVARRDRLLHVAIAKVDGGVRIEVRDNGVGIAAENLPRIFSHGFTTKKTGHGFGLHNCANAAQEMDGSLTAYSDGTGKGASFVLRMPVEYVEPHAARAGLANAGEAP
jgi:signal transduction histidine kinase